MIGTQTIALFPFRTQVTTVETQQMQEHFFIQIPRWEQPMGHQANASEALSFKMA
jgi:hypothetical protein